TEDLRFGDGASVGGTLTIYAEEPDSVTVPDSVAPAARVETETGERLWLFYAHGGAVSGGWFCQGDFG
ncbi:hypothetical protein, partial [Microbacterium sp. ZXX196]|uniref:hypothetical protein n=1 Tax=Microbacterium sp. ZXX196 TaxID=2609291 RepID=UPI0018ACF8B8